MVTFRAFFPSPAWVSGRGTRRSTLVGSSPALVAAVSARLPPAALTRQSSGTPKKQPFSELAAPRGAPYFHVSAIHYFVMLSFLPIPLLHLSITACGIVRSSVAQPLSALRSSASLAFVVARRASLTLASSRFEVCASLLALGRGYVSRFRPLVRLGQCVRCAAVSVGRQQSRFGGSSINPSAPGCSNPPVKWDAEKAAVLRATRLARRPLLLR